MFREKYIQNSGIFRTRNIFKTLAYLELEAYSENPGVFRTSVYSELEAYSEPQYIQNPRHIQNTVKQNVFWSKNWPFGNLGISISTSALQKIYF